MCLGDILAPVGPVRWGAVEAGGTKVLCLVGSDPNHIMAQTHVALEAAYLAGGLRNIVYPIAPQRIVIGGGVTGLPGLFPLLRANLAEALAGYPGLPEHTADDFIVPAALGPLAGPAGALVLADHASQPHRG